MIDIRTYDSTDAGLEELSQLFRSAFPFGAPMSPAYISWSYANPDGPTIALNATEEIPSSIPDAAPAHPVQAWIGLDPDRSCWGRPYVPLPMRLRPAPLNLVFRDLTGQGRCPRPDRARADMLDYDAF